MYFGLHFFPKNENWYACKIFIRFAQNLVCTYAVQEHLSTILFNFLLFVITWQMQTSEAEAMPAPYCWG